jgi:hypothetical protein
MATGKPGRAVRGDLYRSQPLRRRAPVSRRSPAFDRPPEIRRKVDVQPRRGFGSRGSVVHGFGRGRRVRTSLRGFGRRRGSNSRVSREIGPARTGVSVSSLQREPREGKASVELPRGSSRSGRRPTCSRVRARGLPVWGIGLPVCCLLCCVGHPKTDGAHMRWHVRRVLAGTMPPWI